MNKKQKKGKTREGGTAVPIKPVQMIKRHPCPMEQNCLPTPKVWRPESRLASTEGRTPSTVGRTSTAATSATESTKGTEDRAKRGGNLRTGAEAVQAK
jgi:hypothetical protein